jgi:endonuclease/exonuclease/phosphatase family metal-dependent hydrolase
VRHPRARLATLGRELNDEAFDVICLQEIQFSRYISLLKEGFTNYPHQAYEPFIHAPKGGLVTLSHSPVQRQRFVLYEQRGRWHSPALADWILHKGILVTEFVVNQEPVVVVNTHLLANYSADWSRSNGYARHQQAELSQLLSVLGELDRDTLTVVAGDFNLPTHTALYRDFVEAADLYDPLAGNHEPTLHPPRFLWSKHAQPIDHVLIRAPRGRQIQASARIVLRDKIRMINGQHARLSDHSGIAATIQVGEN